MDTERILIGEFLFDFLKIMETPQHYIRRRLLLQPQNIRLRPTPSSFSTSSFERLFRFTHSEFETLLHSLEIPSTLYVEAHGHKSTFSGEDAFMVLLRRLSYPCRWVELSEFFGRSASDLSGIWNLILSFLRRRWCISKLSRIDCARMLLLYEVAAVRCQIASASSTVR